MEHWCVAFACPPPARHARRLAPKGARQPPRRVQPAAPSRRIQRRARPHFGPHASPRTPKDGRVLRAVASVVARDEACRALGEARDPAPRPPNPCARRRRRRRRRLLSGGAGSGGEGRRSRRRGRRRRRRSSSTRSSGYVGDGDGIVGAEEEGRSSLARAGARALLQWCSRLKAAPVVPHPTPVRPVSPCARRELILSILSITTKKFTIYCLI